MKLSASRAQTFFLTEPSLFHREEWWEYWRRSANLVLESAIDGASRKIPRACVARTRQARSCYCLAGKRLAARGVKNSRCAHKAGSLRGRAVGNCCRWESLAKAAGVDEERVLRAGESSLGRQSCT